MPETRPFGGWRSIVTADMVTAGQRGLSYPWIDQGRIFWQESRPAEKGRTTLCCRLPDGKRLELTPAPFNVRTRVHEYGGRAYAVAGDILVAVDDRDQRLWRLGDLPVALTPACDGRMRFADMVIDRGRQRVIAVRETHGDEPEPVNDIVAIALDGSGAMQRLASGHDFFAHPRPSPDGRQLAWISWDHPDMPWDATTLWRGAIGADGSVARVERVAGGPDESILQPEWTASGELVYLSDRTGFWHIYGTERGQLSSGESDHGGPLWQLGMRWYDLLPDGSPLAARVESGLWSLERLGDQPGRIGLPYAVLGEVKVEGSAAVLSAAALDGPGAILHLDLATGRHEIVAATADQALDPPWISRAEPFSFATGAKGEDETAHAFYYPPTNPDIRPPTGELPPMIVRCHGGPTGSASPGLSLKYQYWTSRGFAVCDVNYRGSSGYGRAYRQALNGRWGIADVEDCVAAATHLVAQGKADPERLCIAGGSAGGYTVLCALTFKDTFKAGASSYGIGDLAALARDTHKFEARYLDRLIGPWPEARATYEARSPIHHVDGLSCPVIFFQGLDDKVVPPGQAEAMVAALAAKGIPVAYMPFAGEGHGFRRSETQKAVIEAELAFYCRVFGIEPGEPLPEIDMVQRTGDG